MDTDSFGWLIALVLYIVFISVAIILNAQISELKKENENLQHENEKLQQENTDYKWQIEQVPYVIENWCKGE